jgi:hypothetical protein
MTIATALAPIATGGFTLGAVWLTQHFAERQRRRDRDSAAKAKIEEAALELFDAVSALHLLHRSYVPQWNSWTPKLMTIGSAFIEYTAGRAAIGHEHGMAQVSRAVMSSQARELVAIDGFRAPLERVLAATSRVALLTEPDVRAAALHLSETAAAAGETYGQDALWRRKAAAAARERADTELYTAIKDLHTVLGDWRQSAPRPARWWRRRLRLTWRRGAGHASTALASPPGEQPTGS